MFKSGARRSAVLGCLFVLAAAPSACSSDEAATPRRNPALAGDGEGHLPLRHVRRRDVLDSTR
jgi:hypothetical protein